MLNKALLSLAALASLVPGAIVALKQRDSRSSGLFWSLLAVALAGAGTLALTRIEAAWDTGLSFALWASIAISLLLFAGAAVAWPATRRLAPLLYPYLILLALLAEATAGARAEQQLAAPPPAWLGAHIAVSLVTYGLVTLAAVAALAVFLQERALKRKRLSGLSRLLPSIADAERLQVRLLGAGEVVLGLGLVTGIALQYFETGAFLQLDHKSLLSYLAFLLIGLLLALQYGTGLRGRRAGRLVLVAYLLLTLAYPGVKFVTDVLLA